MRFAKRPATRFRFQSPIWIRWKSSNDASSRSTSAFQKTLDRTLEPQHQSPTHSQKPTRILNRSLSSRLRVAPKCRTESAEVLSDCLHTPKLNQPTHAHKATRKRTRGSNLSLRRSQRKGSSRDGRDESTTPRRMPFFYGLLRRPPVPKSKTCGYVPSCSLGTRSRASDSDDRWFEKKPHGPHPAKCVPKCIF